MQRKPSKRFWMAYDSLHGTIAPQPVQVSLDIDSLNSGIVKAVKRKCPKEVYEQIVAVTRLRKMGVMVHHSPNGGRRNAREGAKFKRMGVSAGFPDLTIPYARKGCHGLYIEIKTVLGGKLSEAQIWWGNFLKKEGYAWYEAKGANEVVRIVCEYLDLKMT